MIDKKSPLVIDKTLEKAFGHALRQLRQERGLSQEALGFQSGYHRTYISLLERGLKSPSLRTLFHLAEVLGVEVAEIMRLAQSKRIEAAQPLENKDGEE